MPHPRRISLEIGEISATGLGGCGSGKRGSGINMGKNGFLRKKGVFGEILCGFEDSVMGMLVKGLKTHDNNDGKSGPAQS
jgi:hypothetical protein